MHMAAAAGTPIVALFGPTHQKRSAPRGSEFIPFYAALECSPCQQYFEVDKCRRGHNYCMDDFDPSSVAAAAIRLIDGRGNIHRARQSSSLFESDS